jgi:hypothetical protein
MNVAVIFFILVFAQGVQVAATYYYVAQCVSSRNGNGLGRYPEIISIIGGVSSVQI